MSDTIQKLNKLKNPESFIQINTIKGFKYIDKAGEIVNIYHRNDVAPEFSVGLNGLVIQAPKDKIYELKVTPQIIWMKFTEIDSLEMISNSFNTESKSILDILNVDTISRVGWRSYFIYEFNNKESQEKYLKKFTNFKNGTLSIARFDLETKKDFKANLMIQPVIKNDENKTPGVLFDIDIFQSGKIASSDILKTLNSFKEFLRSTDDFLAILNGTFSKSE